MPASCVRCAHFRSYNKHGGGAGYCAVKADKKEVCLWAHTIRSCKEFKPVLSG